MPGCGFEHHVMWGQIGYYTLLAITAEAIDADVNKDSVGFWLKMAKPASAKNKKIPTNVNLFALSLPRQLLQ